MKKLYIALILIAVMVSGFLGYQTLVAATYVQPVYESYELVPTADATTNVAQRDVVGNKEDAAAAEAVAAGAGGTL